MNSYQEQAAEIRRQAALLDDTSPLKLCALVLACIAEMRAAASIFQERAEQATDEIERATNIGAAESARIAGDRLLASVGSVIQAIVANRDDQNDELLRIFGTFSRHDNLN